MKRLYILVFAFSISMGNLFAQYTFDQCLYARQINIVDSYCSANGAFTNVGATSDPFFANGCVSLQFQNGVWFSFIPQQAAVSIRIFGSGNGGTMRQPKILLFADCNSFLQCSPGKTISTDELVYENLTLGKTYYIMIESSIGGEGSFKICIDPYTPVPSPQSDCKDGVVLCDKSPFIVQSLTSIGSNTNEIEPNNCIGSEFASSWYKWTCETSGTLTFTLTPNDYISDDLVTSDLDFAVYELPFGIDDCTGKILKRCMASGANGDSAGNTLPLSQWSSCNGLTGLREGEGDINEDPGCQGNSNNFVAPLDMISGKSYVLIINNFSRDGLGFGITFGGSGTFTGPRADFDITALQEFECDKTIQFKNLSSSAADSIISYSWSFGNGALPLVANNEGPIDVIYDSFGDKIVALTIESERGCLVTKLLPIFVEPCCADTSTLGISATATDLSCANVTDGTILGTGSSGGQPYQYSLDGENFQTIPIFYGLDTGYYDVYVQDRKGCENQTTSFVDAPPPLIVDAGPDTTIDLGHVVQIFANYSPITSFVDISWTPIIGFQDCTDCLDPNIKPNNTTTYVIEVIDQNGCTDFDTVVIHTNIVRPVIAPNIITPESGDINSYFGLSLGPAADYIKLLEIYDRWGNRVYSASDIYIDTPYGWDGTFKGEPVDPAVFAWVAEVHFIDDITLTYTGDLTVIR